MKLIAIRNPWGKGEWNGDWSDHSDELNEHREQIEKHISTLEDDDQFTIGEEDGIFFMSFEDWSEHYTKLYICVDFPDSWKGFRFEGQLHKDLYNCGGLPNKQSQKKWARNPQYYFEVEDDQ